MSVFIEIFICILLCGLGIFEAGHLAGVFFGWTISSCGKLILGLLAGFVCALIIWFVTQRKRIYIRTEATKEKENYKRIGFAVCVFIALVMGQLLCVYRNPLLQTSGDIMMETVNSFLHTDGIYVVSPLTGREYSGAPLRYEILCLPTVYTLLCKWLHMNPELLVGRVIPAFTLCISYGAYFLLSGVLFGKKKETLEKRVWFLVILSLVIFFQESAPYMEGYGVLYAGYSGTTIRNSILVPFLLCGVLERKWKMVVLCLLAEICVAWTFWGLGICAAMTAGVLVIGQFCKLFYKGDRFMDRQIKEDLNNE